ncbi:hypothetical protein GQ457_07G038900 [Hibiscus cannabinus]
MTSIEEQRILIRNSHGENLVGILHETGFKDLVIVCHGFQSKKERIPIVTLATALGREGTSAFRFDFVAGNGESEGSLVYGNYRREAEDLRAVAQNCRVMTIHGSMDKIVPAKDALEFASYGADHEYTWHQDELATVVLDFIKAVCEDKSRSKHLHSCETGANFIKSQSDQWSSNRDVQCSSDRRKEPEDFRSCIAFIKSKVRTCYHIFIPEL